MKTPYAILIGLALIAAALFFRQPSIPPAQAGAITTKYMDGFKCVSPSEKDKDGIACAILHGDTITFSLWKHGGNYYKQNLASATYHWPSGYLRSSPLFNKK